MGDADRDADRRRVCGVLDPCRPFALRCCGFESVEEMMAPSYFAGDISPREELQPRGRRSIIRSIA
jgi:hypothetical protein